MATRTVTCVIDFPTALSASEVLVFRASDCIAVYNNCKDILILIDMGMRKVRISDINVYRHDDSGRVFMAPGVTAPNRNAPVSLRLSNFYSCANIKFVI